MRISEAVGSPSGKTSRPVVIANCGQLWAANTYDYNTNTNTDNNNDSANTYDNNYTSTTPTTNHHNTNNNHHHHHRELRPALSYVMYRDLAYAITWYYLTM